MLIEKRKVLQEQLKDLTKNANWMVEPRKKARVIELRALLFPSVFSKSNRMNETSENNIFFKD